MFCFSRYTLTMLNDIQHFNINEADVYVAQFDYSVKVQPVLPDIRQQAIEECTNPLTRLQRYCVWQLLDHALKKRVGMGVDMFNFTVDANGKWHCDQDVHFSLSHSGFVVAVAVCDRPVGIDVDEVGRFSKFTNDDKFVKRVLTEDEQKEFQNVSPERRAEFLAQRWVRKESIFKRDGGEKFTPNQISTVDVREGGSPLEFDGEKYVLSVVM